MAIVLVILVGVVVPGWIGVWLARSWGRRRVVGFAAGAVGGLGGYMLLAALPRRRGTESVRAPDPNEPARQRRLAAADRVASVLYRVVAVVFCGLNVVWLVTTFALMLYPYGLAPLVLAEPGAPIPGVDIAVLALGVALVLPCIYTAAADRRLTRRARTWWLVGLCLTLFVGAAFYVPWRRTRLLGQP